jgi:DNA-binding ferritin-like protein
MAPKSKRTLSGVLGKKGTKKNKTQRAGKKVRFSNSTKSTIVRTFLDMLNTIKLYHWRTQSYAEHKATDELYAELNENIDTFVEILLGKDQSRVTMVEERCRKFNEAKSTYDIKSRVDEYRRFLSYDLDKIFVPKIDSDLLNVRDEILGHLNQFLYLLSFYK